MANTIDQYLTLTISDLRRFGYLRNRAVINGRITWQRDNTPIASVNVTTNTRGASICYLSFVADGEQVGEQIRLMFKQSNLKPGSENGYYYFVCPVTGKCCRKLYYVGGRFVGRSAFRALYPQQAKSRKQREETARLNMLLKFAEILNTRYRKDYYRGKPTPQRLRWERYIERNAPTNPVFRRF